MKLLGNFIIDIYASMVYNIIKVKQLDDQNEEANAMDFITSINAACIVSAETIETMRSAVVNNIDTIINNIKFKSEKDTQPGVFTIYQIAVNEYGLIRMSEVVTDSAVFYVSAACVTIAKKVSLSISIVPRFEQRGDTKTLAHGQLETIRRAICDGCLDCLNVCGRGDYYTAL